MSHSSLELIRTLVTAKRSQLQVAELHLFTREEWMHREAHLSQDLPRGRRGARGQVDRDCTFNPSE